MAITPDPSDCLFEAAIYEGDRDNRERLGLNRPRLLAEAHIFRPCPRQPL